MADCGFLYLLANYYKKCWHWIFNCCYIFLLLNKQYYQAIYSIVSFIFEILYGIYKSIYWNLSQTGDESEDLAKYFRILNHKSLGKEDFSGFVVRFFKNCDLYLSKNFFKIYRIKIRIDIIKDFCNNNNYCIIFYFRVYCFQKKQISFLSFFLFAHFCFYNIYNITS